MTNLARQKECFLWIYLTYPSGKETIKKWLERRGKTWKVTGQIWPKAKICCPLSKALSSILCSSSSFTGTSQLFLPALLQLQGRWLATESIRLWTLFARWKSEISESKPERCSCHARWRHYANCTGNAKQKKKCALDCRLSLPSLSKVLLCLVSQSWSHQTSVWLISQTTKKPDHLHGFLYI